MSDLINGGKASTGDDGKQLVGLGRVTGAHGLQGWLKVHSDTSPRENILSYDRLLLNTGDGWRQWKLNAGRRQGKQVVLKLKGCNDRNQAETLLGAQIAIERSQLMDLAEPGEFYWTDLQGMAVETLEGQRLGSLDHLFETGANDVMVVRGERERLIPFLWGQVVQDVDRDAGVIRVDWDPEF